MAAVTFTSVRPYSTATVTDLVSCGATVGAGQTVYIDTAASNVAKLADNNASAATAVVKGVALTAGVSSEAVIVATGGPIVLVGASMTVGATYYQGATAGEIVPESDLATNNYVSRLGIAETSTRLNLTIVNTGVLHA